MPLVATLPLRRLWSLSLPSVSVDGDRTVPQSLSRLLNESPGDGSRFCPTCRHSPRASSRSSPPVPLFFSSTLFASRAVAFSRPQVFAPFSPTSRPDWPTDKSARYDRRDQSYVGGMAPTDPPSAREGDGGEGGSQYYSGRHEIRLPPGKGQGSLRGKLATSRPSGARSLSCPLCASGRSTRRSRACSCLACAACCRPTARH